MEEEKREGQKTVVAFISGLLIGGLLMWVFGAQPKSNTADEMKKDDNAAVEDTKDVVVAPTDTKADAPSTAEISVAKPEVVAGVGSVAVSNQKAGLKVTLGVIKYPANAGWIAVQNINGDALGTTLGAARFDVKAGLMPKEVSLLATAPTVAGKEYKVVFHSTDGNREYSSATDKVVNGADGKPLATSFKAE